MKNMSNTNAAELAAIEWVHQNGLGHYTKAEIFKAGYTAALSTVPKWKVIDEKNLPEYGAYLLLNPIEKCIVTATLNKYVFNKMIGRGYTH